MTSPPQTALPATALPQTVLPQTALLGTPQPVTPPTIAGTLVFVSSPTSRCGTTLVQRLLNSSPDALVFGEGVGAALVELPATGDPDR